MAFRLFKYMMNICDRHLTIHHENKQIPVIYPMIFYQGKQKYNVARNIFDISVNPELARQFWMNDYHLIDLQNIPDDELKKHDWYGSMAFLMKHIFARDLIKVWEELADKIPTLVKVEIGEAYVKLLLTYTLTKINQDDKVKIRDLLTKKLGNQEGDELMISVAEELYNEGEAKGIAKGIEQTAINMLKQGLDTKLIQQVTGFSREEILRLKSNN